MPHSDTDREVDEHHEDRGPTKPVANLHHGDVEPDFARLNGLGAPLLISARA
jgi:hypothetical protein